MPELACKGQQKIYEQLLSYEYRFRLQCHIVYTTLGKGVVVGKNALTVVHEPFPCSNHLVLLMLRLQTCVLRAINDQWMLSFYASDPLL